FSQQIKDCLSIYLEQTAQETVDILVINHLSPPLHIKWRDLFFFEVVGNHMIRVHAKNRFVEFYGSLSDVAQLDERLWRVHQAFLVNKNQIQHFNSKTRQLTLLDGSQFPVTRTYYERLSPQLKLLE